MSKKNRKSNNRSKNNDFEYEDEDSVDACSECKSPRDPCNCEDASYLTAPAYQPAKTPKHDYREGDVVYCANTQKIHNEIKSIEGTIIQLCGGDAHVLDVNGLIHAVKIVALCRV